MLKPRVNNYLWWVVWLLSSLGLCAYFYYAVNSLDAGEQTSARIFLPGQSSDGHHQIEVACSSCHTEAFGGRELLQDACMQCHADELKQVKDSHPKKKFTDPRNAETLEHIDARYCVTCHVEHRPAMTGAMGVTQPRDFCVHCHADVGEDRPTHKGLDFNTCATGGCHNFHDNQALYEDFLLKHQHEPAHLPAQQVKARELLEFVKLSTTYPAKDYPIQPLQREQADAPQIFLVSPELQDDWLTTQHAKTGVNCTACHHQKDETSGILRWVEKPDQRSCQRCHADENKGFQAGKHGMRSAVELSPMTPEQARLPMKNDVHDRSLTCISCHSAHRFDTRKAAAEVCLQCHDDNHSRNYLSSPHARLWQQEGENPALRDTGVSCATCHLPRIRHATVEGGKRMMVDHNQNNTLRPNEKMLRPVCLQCHGLGFSLDALADPALIDNNFQGQPTNHVKSIDMAQEAEHMHREKKKRRAQDSTTAQPDDK